MIAFLRITERTVLLGSVVLGAAACLALACKPAPSPDTTSAGSGVLVISIDGLRADHLGCMGYDRDTTPSIDALALEGAVFGQVFSAAPQTLPAHVALLTGCDPNVARRMIPVELGVPEDSRWKIPPRVPRLAVEFLLRGYATAAFVDHSLLAPVYGFDPGFENYVESAGENSRREVGIDMLGPRLLQWVRLLPPQKPWFAYLQLNDLERAWSFPDPGWEGYFEARPELDYQPPVAATDRAFFAIPRSRWRGGARTLGQYEALYDGHLRRLDEEIDRLLGGLRAAGRFEDTTVVIVGSHGVQFGEAGLFLCSGRYSMADLHVPFIIRPAAGSVSPKVRGARHDVLVSSVDLPPTLLELAGLEPPAGMHGLSHAARIRGEATLREREFAFASCGIQPGCVVIGERYCLETMLPAGVEDPSGHRAWFGDPLGDERYPERATLRFYDRTVDPAPPLVPMKFEGDPGDLAGLPESFPVFQETAERWLEDISIVRRVLQSRDPRESFPAETLRRLRDLGYLGDGL